MWNNENEFTHDYYKENIIKKFIIEDFIRYDRYKSAILDSIAREIDPKAIEFLELINEIPVK